LPKDNDKSLSFLEVYELILRVWVDRQLPIPLPSRDAARLLFNQEALNWNGKLGREEFKEIVKGSSFRLATHKILTHDIAPLLEWESVRIISGRSLLGDHDIFVA